MEDRTLLLGVEGNHLISTDDKDSVRQPYQVRRKVKGFHAKVLSKFPMVLRTYGYRVDVTLEEEHRNVVGVLVKGKQRMRNKLAQAIAGTKFKLRKDVPGIEFNPVEIFPIDPDRCVVLVTGHIPAELIVQMGRN